MYDYFIWMGAGLFLFGLTLKVVLESGTFGSHIDFIFPDANFSGLSLAVFAHLESLQFFVVRDLLLNYVSSYTLELVLYGFVGSLTAIGCYTLARRYNCDRGLSALLATSLLFIVPFQNVIVGYEFELFRSALTIGMIGVSIGAIVILFSVANNHLAANACLLGLIWLHPLNASLAATLVLFRLVIRKLVGTGNFSVISVYAFSFLASVGSMMYGNLDVITDSKVFDLISVINGYGTRGGFFFPWLNYLKLDSLIICILLVVVMGSYIAEKRSWTGMHGDLFILSLGGALAFVISFIGWYFEVDVLARLAPLRIYAYLVPFIGIWTGLILIQSYRDNLESKYVSTLLVVASVQSPMNLLLLAILHFANIGTGSRWSRMCLILVTIAYFVWLAISVFFFDRSLGFWAQFSLVCFISFIGIQIFEDKIKQSLSALWTDWFISRLVLAFAVVAVVRICALSVNESMSKAAESSAMKQDFFSSVRIIKDELGLVHNVRFLSFLSQPVYYGFETFANYTLAGFGLYGTRPEVLSEEFRLQNAWPTFEAREFQSFQELYRNRVGITALQKEFIESSFEAGFCNLRAPLDRADLIVVPRGFLEASQFQGILRSNLFDFYKVCDDK